MSVKMRHGVGGLRRGATMALGAVVAVALFGVSLERTTPAAATSTTVPGCGASSPGSTTLTPTVNGHQRTVIVHVPRGSSNSSPRALILNLHGSGSAPAAQEAFTGMNRSANADGFIVAYPQGSIVTGTGFDWNVPHEPVVGGAAVPKGTPNDVKFLTDLVGVLEQHYCVNPAEVYATGFSGGARMVSQLACDASSVFAAVAPVSGLRRPSPCPTTRAVPVIAFHGSADPVDPFAGHGEAYWTYSVSTAAKDWATQDKCTGKPTTNTTSAQLKVTDYATCADGAAVELYELVGEGHEWPGGPVMPAALVSALGPQSSAANATTLMWAFFQAHPLHS